MTMFNNMVSVGKNFLGMTGQTPQPGASGYDMDQFARQNGFDDMTHMNNTINSWAGMPPQAQPMQPQADPNAQGATQAGMAAYQPVQAAPPAQHKGSMIQNFMKMFGG